MIKTSRTKTKALSLATMICLSGAVATGTANASPTHNTEQAYMNIYSFIQPETMNIIDHAFTGIPGEKIDFPKDQVDLNSLVFTSYRAGKDQNFTELPDGARSATTNAGTLSIGADGNVNFVPDVKNGETQMYVNYKFTDTTGEHVVTGLIAVSLYGKRIELANDNAVAAGPSTSPVVIDVLANDNKPIPDYNYQSDFPIDPATLILNPSAPVYPNQPAPPEGTGNAETKVVTTQGTWEVVDGKVHFTPAIQPDGKPFVGVTGMKYNVKDTGGNYSFSSPTVEVAVVSTDQTDAPRNDKVTTKVNTPVTLDIFANDPAVDWDGQPTTYDPKSVKLMSASCQPAFVPSFAKTKKTTTRAMFAAVGTDGYTLSDDQRSVTGPEGTFQVQDDGTVLFTPAEGFVGKTASIPYCAMPSSGDMVQTFAYMQATVTGPPAVSIETYANDDDADAAPGVAVEPGSKVALRYVVKNTGGEDLTNISVTDDKGNAMTCEKDALAVGESMTCTAEVTADAQGEVQYTAVGKVTATSASGAVTAEDAVNFVTNAVVTPTPDPTDPPTTEPAPTDPPTTEPGPSDPPTTEPTDPPTTQPTDPGTTEPTDPPTTEPTDPGTTQPVPTDSPTTEPGPGDPSDDPTTPVPTDSATPTPTASVTPTPTPTDTPSQTSSPAPTQSTTSPEPKPSASTTDPADSKPDVSTGGAPTADNTKAVVGGVLASLLAAGAAGYLWWRRRNNGASA